MKSKKINEKKPVNLLITAGETSGDLLGSSIIRELKKKGDYQFWGLGGDQMKKERTDILLHIDKMSTLGFWEGVKKIRFFKKLINQIVKETERRKPKAVILVDFSGFSVRLAEALSRKNIPCYKIVSPQFWAWNYKRIHRIKKAFKSVLCLYDFEVTLYKKEKANAFFMGHPLADDVKESLKKMKLAKAPFRKTSQIKNRPRIALLPGSRFSEIKNHMPFLIELAQSFHKEYPEAKFEVPASGKAAEKLIKSFNLPSYVSITAMGTHKTLAQADCAAACSGTVTLECALLETPFFIFYKTSWLTYRIGKMIMQIPYIGIVNMIFKDFLAREFLQHEMTLKNALPELKKLSFDEFYRTDMRNNFVVIKKALGEKDAAKKAASFLHEEIRRLK
ncbi:MAG: lipid-A-disaccharide synthase [Spirochaetia bacterium]|nr:lipid-A-disaccharide synthase [Spirochaetia bacterium]